MEQDNQSKQPQRRVKVKSSETNRAGTLRAGIKPHKRTTESAVKTVINSYLSGLKTGSLTQTYTGTTLTKNAAALRSNFGLSSSDELFLLSDPTATGKAGLLLSTSGVNLADGRGGRLNISWSDFAGMPIKYQRGTLQIGQSGITTNDGQAIATLLQQIQAKLAK